MWAPRGRNWIRLVPSGRRAQGGKNTPPLSWGCSRPSVRPWACPLHEVAVGAEDITPFLEAQSVPVFPVNGEKVHLEEVLRKKQGIFFPLMSSLLPITPQKPTVPRTARRTPLKPEPECLPFCPVFFLGCHLTQSKS